ncbi:MAG: hypothetical protein ACREA3_06140 [Nitrosotalea sp.]
MSIEEIHSRLEDWQEEGLRLKKELLDYNWQYRKKICIKCPMEQKIKLNCHKVNNFVDGIQETHCRKLIRARTQKFRKQINEFLDLHPYAREIKL